METITLINTFTEDSQYNPCTEIAVGNSLDLERTISGTPSNISSLSLWFKREESAILKLGTINDCLQIAADGTLALVASGTKNSNFQKDSSDITATVDLWHHLAWIKNNDKHTLYLNGIACQTQTLAEAPNPATINDITSEGNTAYVVHIRTYDRALEAVEVVADKMSQYNATQSFTDQYPLNFTLKDRLIEGAPEVSDDKLIIEDIVAKERTYQRLVITNVAEETLSFVPNSNAVSKDNHHFEVRFRNGTLVEPEKFPIFNGGKYDETKSYEKDDYALKEQKLYKADHAVGANTDWNSEDWVDQDWKISDNPEQNLQDGSWSVYLLRTAALNLASNDTLEFPFEYTTADGSLGGRSTRVALRYNHIQYAYTSYNQWQQTNAYTIGSYVFYNEVLYKAKQDIDNNKAWNNNQWENMTWQDTNVYTKGDFVVKEGGRYVAKDEISAGDWNNTQWEVLDLIQGIREKQIDIINNSSNNAHVSALNKKVTAADAKVDQLEEDAREEINRLTNLLNEQETGIQKVRVISSSSNKPISINAWQETKSYTLHDYVTKDGVMYRSTSGIAANTPWNVANWENRSWDASSSYAKEDYVQTDAKIYRATQGIEVNTPWDETQWEVYAPSKEVLKSIIGVLGTLAHNIKAVDDEVDARAAASDYIADQQEMPFPLVASVCALTHDDQPAAGVVRGVSTSKLQFTLNNIGLSPVTFTKNAEFRFILPLGSVKSDLSASGSAAGSSLTPSAGGTFLSNDGTSESTVYTWTPPDTTENEDNVTVNGTNGTLSFTGKTISFTLENANILENNHTPRVSYNQTTEGVEQVTTSINNNKLYITITGIRVGDTDKWPSVGDLANSLNKLSGISGASGNTETLEPNNVGGIASRESKTFTISGITPNSEVGFVPIFIEYQGIVGHPSGKLSVAVSKVSKDIAQLVGGGNVGIGTTNPKSKLDVEGGVAIGTNYSGTYAAPGNGLLVEGKVGIGTTDPTQNLHVTGNASGNVGITVQNKGSGNPQLRFLDANNNERAAITFLKSWQNGDKGGIAIHDGDSNILNIRDGNVGIGTTNPTEKLEVKNTDGSYMHYGSSGNLQLISPESSNATVRIGAAWNRPGIYSSRQLELFSDQTGIIFGDSNIERMRLTANGRLGIGTSSPSDTLHVNGVFRQTYGGNTFRMWQDSQRLILSIKSSYHGSYKKISWDGDTNWDVYSDRRLKTNIEEEKNILKRLAQLKVKNFNWKDDPNNKRKMIGFIAQDVQPLFPTLVKENNDENSNEKKLTIPYASFGILAVGAIKELKDEKDAEITAMQQEIRDLKKNNKEQAELLNKQQQQLLELSRKVEQLLRK